MSWRKPERKDYGGDFLGQGGGEGIPVSQYHVLDVRDKGCLKTWTLREKMEWIKGTEIQVGTQIGNVLVGGDKRMKGIVQKTEVDVKRDRFIVTFRVVFQDHKE